jgi:hypothetical protein
MTAFFSHHHENLKSYMITGRVNIINNGSKYALDLETASCATQREAGPLTSTTFYKNLFLQKGTHIITTDL